MPTLLRQMPPAVILSTPRSGVVAIAQPASAASRPHEGILASLEDQVYYGASRQPSMLLQGKGARNMPTNTVRLHRVLRATPERVYRAFLDPDAMAKWLPPNGFTGKVHQMDAKVGGTYKMSFTNFTTGQSISFGGKYLELVPHERLRYTDKFDDPNLPGEIQVTITLKKCLAGPR